MARSREQALLADNGAWPLATAEVTGAIAVAKSARCAWVIKLLVA